MLLDALSDSCIAGSSWSLIAIFNYGVGGEPPVTVEYLPGGNVQSVNIPSAIRSILPSDNPWTHDDFWSYLGILFETFHWIFLADFGQISPTSYFDTVSNPVNLPFFNFTTSKTFPTTNNVFINPSLYEIARNAKTSDFLPASFYGVPNFNETKDLPLTENETVFVQSYLCEQRRLKSPFSLLITVLVADYALIIGAYNLVLMIARIIEKSRKEGGTLLLVRSGLTS
jgi:hypothetical protein